MSAADTGPTPEERLWAADASTPAIVLAKLARFPELRPLVREHPAAYPDLVAWIDAQAEAQDVAAPTPDGASKGRSPLVVAVAVAVASLAAAGVMLGVTQPWASAASTAQPAPSSTVGAVASPTPTPTAVAAATVEGTVVVPAGANLRAEPSPSSAKIGGFPHNAVVPIICFVRGVTVTDALGTTDVWYSVDAGYISAAILLASNRSAVAPCDE